MDVIHLHGARVARSGLPAPRPAEHYRRAATTLSTWKRAGRARWRRSRARTPLKLPPRQSTSTAPRLAPPRTADLAWPSAAPARRWPP